MLKGSRVVREGGCQEGKGGKDVGGKGCVEGKGDVEVRGLRKEGC